MKWETHAIKKPIQMERVRERRQNTACPGKHGGNEQWEEGIRKKGRKREASDRKTPILL